VRTTLTIDKDVAALLEALRKRRNIGFKELVNDALRRGLKDMDSRPQPRKPFRTRTTDLGPPRLAGLDNMAEAIAMAEGDAWP
jgi:hypothetical protein